MDMEFNEKRNPPANQFGLIPNIHHQVSYVLTMEGHFYKFSLYD